jgi:hypothetical protein
MYKARRWNQRYCQEPTCLKLVRRWQAAKRQEERRRQPEVREAHAAAERERRARRCAPREPPSKREPTPQEHQDRCAWSRSKNFSGPSCDRPGCYDAVRPSCRCRARYCSDDCRQAVKRVRDRERKWLDRTTRAERFKRRLEEEAERRARLARGGTVEVNRDSLPGTSSSASRQL